ncbi:hypothetical protein [Neisseria sp.]|uniref:hypothetical protein n=1 Tax=Neisseria sp. TaxID=192066 RepID=UPI0026DC92FA|nr:hypothetical protein [Neisseria sp.]MDO4226200.1 hypothetical protein [Neisseria sp.]
MNELDTAEAGKLFIEKLIDEVNDLRRELHFLENRIRIEDTLQAERNKLFGESMLLSVLLLRYIKEGDKSVLSAAENKLAKLIKQSVVFGTQCSMPISVWRELVEACGKVADTRELKNLSKSRKPPKRT